MKIFKKLIDYRVLNDQKITFYLFCTKSGSCSIILSRTKNLFPAPAPDCLCTAGLRSWSGTLFLNSTSKNILPLCNVLFPGSLHPLRWKQSIPDGTQPLDNPTNPDFFVPVTQYKSAFIFHFLKRGVIAKRLAKGLLLNTVTPGLKPLRHSLISVHMC